TVSARIRGGLLAFSDCFHVVFSWQVVRLRFPDRVPCEGGSRRAGLSAAVRAAPPLAPTRHPDRSLKADQRHGDARWRQSILPLLGRFAIPGLGSDTVVPLVRFLPGGVRRCAGGSYYARHACRPHG